ncbi:hypothetical protein HU200_006807 [Digitaria exilis]|uniref:CBS domain-containing protein n=1 Tax=Digitaria exilis TaxID=1010633 RepID=A0A835KRT4_9POAL|nr:hypothetical protein HU200_006807 [Digitaria exilis]
MRLLQTHDVSDLCIGKPALRWLPASATVADAVAELDRGATAVAVWDGDEGSPVAGRVSMADVLLFLCAGDNLASPAAALQATLSDLLLAAAAPPPVRRIEPDASVVEAVDSLLGGAHCLVVPVRDRWRAGRGELCWLTVEDVARFFLSSIGLFSPTASRSVSELGVVRPATLAVAAGDTALSALPLLRAAVASHTSVAVVVQGMSPPRRSLVGEISPSALCSCDVSAAAAIAALSAGDFLGFVDQPEIRIHAVRSRLRRRNLLGMLDLLLYGGVDPSSSSSSASSSSSSSSDEDEDDEEGKSCVAASPCGRRGKRGGVFSARGAMGEEAIACQRGSSLVAVMVQALAHRSTHVWVVDYEEEEEGELVGVVGLLDVLRVLRHHLL